MSKASEISQLRARAGRVLKSQACLDIRFRFPFDGILIQRFMYTYVGQAIMDDLVHLDFSNNPGYDPDLKTFFLEGPDVGTATIVHEATHIIINATHVGKVITKGAHEMAGYLAETLWALNSDNEISVDVPVIRTPLRRLALKIQAYNSGNKSGSFPCPPDDTNHIKALLKNSGLGMEADRKYLQTGIGDGPK
jgi:hypothetical protein